MILDDSPLIQRIFSSLSNGVTIADATRPDNPLIWVNPAFERMTGYSFGEVVGRNCRFLQGSDRNRPELEVVRAALRERRECKTTIRNYRKDGSLFWNELYLSPVCDQANRLTHFVGIQNDVTVRVEAQERLAFLAHHDNLTGLANRTLLVERLKQALSDAKARNTMVALLFLDLDNMKTVNDVYGHETGDLLLACMAKRLEEELRSSDIAARIGGDEFVLMVSDLEESGEIQHVIYRVSERIKQTVTLLDQEFHPSASIGAALFPADGDTPESLLKAADFAMYAIKHEAKRAAMENESIPRQSVTLP